MNSELQLRWALWAIVVFISLQCLISMSTLLRDRLQKLLVAHVKKAQIEGQKKRRIVELREKIRAKKVKAAEEASKVTNKDTTEKKAA